MSTTAELIDDVEFGSEPTTLVVIPASALPAIVAADKDDLLGKLAVRVAAFRPDISTARGREEMRALAYEIARTRSKLDSIGKGVGDDARKTVDAINAERRALRERLEELQEKVRGPLTAWENAEKERVAAHEAGLQELANLAVLTVDGATTADVHDRMARVQSWVHRNWQEFHDRASYTAQSSADTLKRIGEAVAKREAEAVEMERLRAEKAERDRQDAEMERHEREARIAAAAAEQAKHEAEAKAEAARVEAARQAREAEESAARALAAEKRRAEEEAECARQAIAAEQERARKAEADRVAAIELAKEQAAQADRDRIAAEAKAKSEQATAIEAERARVAKAAAQAKREADARGANKEHRAEINRAACWALMDHAGCGIDTAEAVIAAIIRKQIPHVTIDY
jgi:hypothetical protein